MYNVMYVPDCINASDSQVIPVCIVFLEMPINKLKKKDYLESVLVSDKKTDITCMYNNVQSLPGGS